MHNIWKEKHILLLNALCGAVLGAENAKAIRQISAAVFWNLVCFNTQGGACDCYQQLYVKALHNFIYILYVFYVQNFVLKLGT